MRKYFLPPITWILIFFIITTGPIISYSTAKDSREDAVAVLDTSDIIKGILFLQNPYTRLTPSHWGHPGYEDLAFLYDSAVNALVLKAAGYQTEAEEILDYFADRLRIPISDVISYSDTNKVYGILKFFEASKPLGSPHKGLINAIDVTSNMRQGTGILEFYTTPGPMSFLIFAMLNTNPTKYQKEAILLGETMLSMQDPDGGIHDGDRAPERVHTEPHMDAYAAFIMLYQLTRDLRWKNGAERAYRWFEKNVYHPEDGTIDQGVWQQQPSTIFAEDVYSWTMAGPAGERLTPEAIKRLTLTMLRKSLVRITLALPDLRRATVTLCDFSNPKDYRVKGCRAGYHPIGSVEWTGGAILALQKNAVRLWNFGDKTTAQFYKAIAEFLLSETSKCFYSIEGLDGIISFYATGQGMEVAPFGAIGSKFLNGWKTPYFYVKTKRNKVLVKGGSTVGAWPLLPYLGLNPFILGDYYKAVYNKIPLSSQDKNSAKVFIDNMVMDRKFTEKVPEALSKTGAQIIVEPRMFNQKLWQAVENAYFARKQKRDKDANEYFREAIKWANRTVNHMTWFNLAKRDNAEKQKEYGGIIYYPWGSVYANNDNPIHTAILKYPLLNEMGIAMWGLVTAYYELGDYKTAKYWIGRMIDDVSLHQIPDVVRAEGGGQTNIIQGYWNALVLWEDAAGGSLRDAKIGQLYKEVLETKGLTSAKPKIVDISKKVYGSADSQKR